MEKYNFISFLDFHMNDFDKETLNRSIFRHDNLMVKPIGGIWGSYNKEENEWDIPSIMIKDISIISDILIKKNRVILMEDYKLKYFII